MTILRALLTSIPLVLGVACGSEQSDNGPDTSEPVGSESPDTTDSADTGVGTDHPGTDSQSEQPETVSGDPFDPYDKPRQACVNKINEYRASIGVAALERWRDGEPCADDEALTDSQSGVAHGAFGQCGEFAQNECPGWPSVDSTTTSCLEMMWNEGPGDDFSQHGHYINMSNPGYTMVACGFSEGPNGVWAVQNFK